MEIKNATYAQVKAIINETTLASIASKDEPAIYDWALIEGLRTSLANAMVTTYRYKPLVGILTITDPAGTVTYYEYDSFNRLKRTYIKENSVEKTIRSYDYRYQNQ